jgi:hypothetical protein
MEMFGTLVMGIPTAMRLVPIVIELVGLVESLVGGGKGSLKRSLVVKLVHVLIGSGAIFLSREAGEKLTVLEPVIMEVIDSSVKMANITGWEN